MKVLLYINQIFLEELTGQGSFERELLGALARRVGPDPEAEMVVFTVRPPGKNPPPDSSPCRMVHLTLDKGSYRGFLAHQWRLFRSLCRFLREYRESEAAIYLRYNPSMLAPALAAMLYRRPLTFRTGPILPNLHLHGITGNFFVVRLVKALLWLHCRVARTIVVATGRIGQWVGETFPFAREKVVVISNGVNLRAIGPAVPDRARWGLPEREFVMGFVGTLWKDQGLDVPIRAMGELKARGEPVPHLLVVGDGPCREEWNRLAKSLGVLENVVFAGRRPHEEIPSAISACDVMLAPFSKRSFDIWGSSSMKLFEYLACDRPVLASRSGDHDFFEERGVGWLAEPDDVREWADSIRERMCGGNTAMAGRARRLAEEEYSIDSVAEKIWSACFSGGPFRGRGSIARRKID